MSTITLGNKQVELKNTTASDPSVLHLKWNDYSVRYVSGYKDTYTHGQNWNPITIPVYDTVTLTGVKNVVASLTDLPTYMNETTSVYTIDGAGVINKATKTLIPVLTLPTNSTGGVRYITSREVEGFRITLSIAGLYGVDPSSGYVANSVSVAAFYRVYDEANPNAPWSLSKRSYVVSGTSRSEILKWWEEGTETEPLPLARYEIFVIRNTEDHSSSFTLVDPVYLKEVTEINYRKLRYNNTALLGVKIRATDQLSGQLPTITSLVKGLKVSVPDNCVGGDGKYNRSYSTPWNGGLNATKVWTDNPVWCLYDLLTNPRYGLGEYYKIAPEKHGLLLANFYLMAKYCDETINYVDVDGQAKSRPRFSLNIVIDQSKNASEWISTISAVMRATVFYNEGLFWIDIDRPKYISQIFNMSSIKDYTQTGTSYRSVPNTYEVQWINPDIGYEVDVFRVEDEEVQLNQHIEERKKALMLIGVTNFDQAKSLARYALLAGKQRTKLVTFKTGTQALRSMVADVIAIQHDVPEWGWGGKIVSATQKSAGVYGVTLSSPVDCADSTLLQMVITPSSQNLGPLTLPVQGVTTSNGVTVVTVSTTYTDQSGGHGVYVPLAEDSYILNLATNSLRTFKILSIKRDPDEQVEIAAVEYDEQIYSMSDDTSPMGAWVTRNYSLAAEPARCSVTGVYVNKKIYQDSSGSWKVGVEVFYDIPQSSFWKGARLHYSINGVDYTDLPTIDTSGRFFVADLTDTGDYTFVVTSVYSSGQQSVSDAFTDTEAHPFSYQRIDMYTPNDSFLLGVTGLSIENRANDGTFKGRDCVIVWKSPLALDAAAGGTDTGAGATTTSQWLRHYMLEFKGMDGTSRRTVMTSDTRYVYTSEMNHADADINREFTVTVTAVDRIGRVSDPKTITCKNPAPPALA